MPTGSILVVGSGPNLNEDLAKVEGDFDVMVINHAIRHYKGIIKYWASWHDMDDILFNTSIAQRGSDGLNLPERIFSFFACRRAEHTPLQCYGGGSTLFGVLVCVQQLGYTKVVVANSPLTGQHEEFQQGWTLAKDDLAVNVRALSGFPMEMLGMPTQEWLDR